MTWRCQENIIDFLRLLLPAVPLSPGAYTACLAPRSRFLAANAFCAFASSSVVKTTSGYAGCSPTALAIAVASLTSHKVTPADTAQWSVENGGLCEGSGSYHSLIPNGGRHYGLTVTSIGRDGKKLVEALQEGKLAIAIMSKGHFTDSGHFIIKSLEKKQNFFSSAQRVRAGQGRKCGPDLDYIVSTGAFYALAGSARRKITCDFSSVLTISSCAGSQKTARF